MTNEKILEGNKFSDCSIDELRNYWTEMKESVYENGWIAVGTPLGNMRDVYCKDSSYGMVVMERDLLTAIVCSLWPD